MLCNCGKAEDLQGFSWLSIGQACQSEKDSKDSYKYKSTTCAD